MFRQLASVFPTGVGAFTELQPWELTALQELFWEYCRAPVPPPSPGMPPFLGHPDNRSALPGLPTAGTSALLAGPGATPGVSLFVTAIATAVTAARTANPLVPPYRGEHLIYAYMIENSRIYEIFRRVIHDFLHGERLSQPSIGTQLWLRNTEELFYRDSPTFGIGTISSHIRADSRSQRRNAYQRMFGMDLNHGSDDGKPYPYIKADATNLQFVLMLEQLLSEVWIGFMNLQNAGSENPTDDAKIADLADTLHDMLQTRRNQGNLSREEFIFTAMMSWFHLAVETDSLPIVTDLRANAASPEQRLFKIAERVGLPAHGLSKHYFDIADSISTLLIEIETGNFNTVATAPALYDGTAPGSAALVNAILTVIRHWSVITGRDLKAKKLLAA